MLVTVRFLVELLDCPVDEPELLAFKGSQALNQIRNTARRNEVRRKSEFADITREKTFQATAQNLQYVSTRDSIAGKPEICSKLAVQARQVPRTTDISKVTCNPQPY